MKLVPSVYIGNNTILRSKITKKGYMKKRRFAWIGIVLVLLTGLSFCTASDGKTWHVSGETLAGIEQQQVRTISRAAALAGPGDTVIIHSGIYREAVEIEKSGKPGNPITFQTAAGAGVIMTGADRISEWAEVKGDGHIYSTPWPHKFITWNRHNTHPDDDYHRLIGRCEQVFINGYVLRQVLERDKLARGTFYVDLDGKRLYVWNYNNQEISKKAIVEASVRDRILTVKGDYVTVKGIRFRYAANRAQRGAVEFSGNHLTVEDCIFEYTNAGGASFRGEDITVRRCMFQHNGQLGFGANRAHRLRMTGCTVRNNNIKGFNRSWEAGGNKICLARGVVLENSTFIENRGNGIWFDIGNEDCTVRNCLIAFNEDAGIFYEISYGLHAHDNVIVGNGLAGTPAHGVPVRALASLARRAASSSEICFLAIRKASTSASRSARRHESTTERASRYGITTISFATMSSPSIAMRRPGAGSISRTIATGPLKAATTTLTNCRWKSSHLLSEIISISPAPAPSCLTGGSPGRRTRDTSVWSRFERSLGLNREASRRSSRLMISQRWIFACRPTARPSK